MQVIARRGDRGCGCRRRDIREPNHHYFVRWDTEKRVRRIALCTKAIHLSPHGRCRGSERCGAWILLWCRPLAAGPGVRQRRYSAIPRMPQGKTPVPSRGITGAIITVRPPLCATHPHRTRPGAPRNLQAMRQCHCRGSSFIFQRQIRPGPRGHPGVDRALDGQQTPMLLCHSSVMGHGASRTYRSNPEISGAQRFSQPPSARRRPRN